VGRVSIDGEPLAGARVTLISVIELLRWVQLPFMIAIENRLQPLVVILLMIFDVATVAKDVHLPESHNAAFRALV
jgi:hypothetical protein